MKLIKPLPIHYLMLSIVLLVFIWSGWGPNDRLTWWLEVFPVIIALPILIFTFKKFPLTPLIYWLIVLHVIVLMVGGHYTYAEVPLFNWLKEEWGLVRNEYDKVGHFMQGFVPVMIAREILLRTSPLKPGKWLVFIVLCIVLAIAASYEIIEWLAAELLGQSAESFLGTQGYIWDTQADMGWALVGGVVALILLSKLHDNELGRQKYH